jgi:hypothetical protein
MEELLLNTKIPYGVDFVRPRRRKWEKAVLWDDGRLVVDCVSAAEAPAAYQISTTNREHGHESFSVRTFDRRLFWPVLRRFGSMTTLKEFTDGIAVGSTTLLRLMNSGISMDYCLPKMSEEAFRREIPARDVKMESRDRVWARFRAGSRRVLVIDSLVYVEGGEPLLFGAFDGDGIILTIGPTDHPGTYSSTDHRIPGPSTWTRELAARRGLVFGAFATPQVVSSWGTHRRSLDFKSSIESAVCGPQLENSATYCALTLFRHLEKMPALRTSDATSAVDAMSLALERERLGHRADGSVCRGARNSPGGKAPAQEGLGPLSEERETATRLLARLPSRSFSAEEDDALASLSA